jgi:amino acid adenylation domain-containing protein
MSKASLSQQALSAEQKRRLLEQLLQRKARQQAIIPLSTAQQRLWFFEQLQGANAVYNIVAPARLHGELNLDALRKSIQVVMRRHEALRTIFILQDGMPVQQIQDEPVMALLQQDLRHLPEEVRAEEAHRLLLEDARRPFDLQQGPLLRMTIVQLTDNEHLLLLNMHHIIADGWSCEIILRELSQLYSAYAQGQELSLPEQAIQYSHFVSWQKRRLQGPSDQLAYWQQQLKDVQPLQLPLERARPVAPTYRGGRRWRLLAGNTLEQLKALSRQEGVTLYMTLLSAFTLLLARYSGQEDIVIGTPSAGRSRHEFENVVGCFINMLALRNNLTGKASFLEVVQHTRQIVLDAYTHQDVPFEQVVEAVTTERDVTRNPLFQVQFAFQNVTMQNLQLAGLAVEPYQLHNHTTKLDLSLFVWEEAGGLMTSVEYNADLFTDAAMQRLLGHLHTLLEQVVAHPDQSWATLPMLTQDEQQQILYDWNATAAEPLAVMDVQTLFEAQVDRTPEATALVAGQKNLSYWTVDQRANQLAHYLQRLGVRADTLVGVCMKRTPELVITILGILKAGGAYLPLDPSYPADRMTYIAENARLKLILADEHLCDRLPAHVHRICPRLEASTIALQSTGRPARSVAADNLAYVIYTSGSTGTPKGVMISHRGLFNYLTWASQHYNVAAGNGSVVHSSLAFDLTVTSLFPALLHGKQVVLVPEEQAVEHLAEIIRKGLRFSLLKITPAHLDMLGQLVLPQELAASANALVIGGEALRAESVELWRQFAPATRLINEYGPTETVVGCCIYEVTAGDANTGEIPIGRPIANTALYVLDKHLCPVPVGVPGELYIGGLGVARGYVNRPELTAERFIPDPYGRTPGSRCYKTGDLVRYRADGVLEFLGRVDHQVKLRGYRIELGEIEAAILRSSVVREAVVVVHGKNHEDKSLIAYVTGELTQSEAATILQQHLETLLPAYMIPAQFIVLQELPLTSNGKVDRRALPEPQTLLQTSAQESVAPITPLEQVIASVWEQLLERPQIGRHENFFALGGHSLLAGRVIARLRSLLHIELPLRSLFEAPTIARLAQRIEAQLRDGAEQDEQPLQADPERGSIVPLALAQQRLWFLEQLETPLPLYNVPLAFRLQGELNEWAWQQSLWDVVRRHESLRTTFEEQNGEPVQRIHGWLAPQISQHDLRQCSAEQQEQQVQALWQQEQHWRFDLRTGPLLRVSLLQVGEQAYVLLVNLHHLITDAWSVQVLLSDWEQCYVARCQGEQARLTPLAVQYGDYALWQRQWLQGERIKQQERYWQQHLQGAPELLEVPTDRPRGTVAGYRGASERFELDQELVEGLKRLGQQEGTSLYMSLLAGYQLLLSRYTQQHDIVVGTPSGQRVREELAGLIGFLINTLVMRTDLSGNPSVREVLGRVRKVALDGYSHQDVPFERIVELVGGERDLSHMPLCQVSFVYEHCSSPIDRGRQRRQFGDLQLSQLEHNSDVAKFELTLGISETADGYRGTIQYNRDLFDAATIKRLGQHYVRLLQAMVADPDQLCSMLPLLTEQEEQALLIQWNATEREYSRSCCVHELFEEQVRRTPNNTAVIFEQSSLSYAELDRRATLLAAHLRQMGVKAETRVALCMERSLELVVSILGVLKAGGAYVPLDPAYPRERLAFMLQDSQAPIVISTRTLASMLPSGNYRQLFIDDFAADASLKNSRLPFAETGIRAAATAENTAYVIYTSGSTGTPKGVMIPHRALCNHMCWMQQAFPLDATDRVLQKTPFSFDASVWEFFAPLLNGACLVMAQPGSHGDSQYLAKTVAQQRITVLQLVPSLLRVLLEEEELEHCQHLRHVFCGGEALTIDLQRRFYQRVNAKLHNLYGPTEACIDTTFWSCERESDRTFVPIGRPVANTQHYILDANLQPTPINVPGELYIGGAGLAHGYLNRPELTAERFVPDPFVGTRFTASVGDVSPTPFTTSSQPGSRLYRTGDLARYRADGAIEYLGRLDHQVKLRGFRIELGEIEARLLQHPAVRQAVVIVREDRPGDQLLVGYVVAQAGADSRLDELRTSLYQDLPEYMVPTVLIPLDQLPLTPNGKVDRRALPEPQTLSQAVGQESVAPITPLEQVIASVWEQLLERPQIGRHENFFALGGHSLLAGRVIARLRSLLHIELPLRSLFEAPTIARFAQRITAQLRDGTEQDEQPLQADPARGSIVPLALAQQRLWFLEQLETPLPLYNVPLAFRLQGELNEWAWQQSLWDVVRRHESLRTTFEEQDGEAVQRIHAWLAPQISRHDLRQCSAEQQEQQVQALWQQEQHWRFDLRTGPLLRVSLLQVGEQAYVLLVNLHHLITDAWSVQVLLSDWEQCYVARCQGEQARLTPLAVQYGDYALWQRQWLQGERIKQQERYWQQHLQGAPELLEVPTDRPRGTVAGYRGASERFELDQELVEGLKRLGQQEGTSLYMSLLAGYQLLLSRYTQQHDIVVGTPSGQRVREELAGLIGFLINTLVMRTDLSGNPSVREVLGRVRKVALDGYSHQDVPFERIVELVGGERDLSHMPLFQAAFIYEYGSSPIDRGRQQQFGDLLLSSIDLPTSIAKLELSLVLRETEHGLQGAIVYNRDLFNVETIQRMCMHYQQLLKAMLVDPGRTIAELTMLTPAEYENVIRSWNATQYSYPNALSVPQLIDRWAERTPLAIAIEAPERQKYVSYQQLSRQSNQIARYLQQQGVGQESLVCVCMERSAELLIAELAILKAGSAYVPLDPAHPISRLAFMLQDIQPPVLLTQQHLLDIVTTALQECDPVNVVCIDNLQAACWQEEPDNVEQQIALDQLAYVIYTSGSTGQPKGVQVAHRGLLNLIDWYQRTFQVTHQDRSTHLAGVGFDGTVWEVWPALTAGATLVLPDEQVKLSADLLQQWYIENGITLSFAPTPLAEQMLTMSWPKNTALRYLQSAGDQLHVFPPPDLPFTLVNAYGPTENTVDATCEFVATAAQAGPGERPSIGRPIANVETYVLDSCMRPVPIGVPGELYLGGVALARGYLHRADLTAERFVPHPFSLEAGARLYKTGDVCSYLPDGRINFIGRNDRQVKLRGFRIELGEIETLILRHPAVSQVAVVVHVSATGQKQLVAYLLAEAGQSLESSELRQFLREQVPEYMVPSYFIVLEAFPLTSNGKLDRKALPAPEQTATWESQVYVAPQTQMEQQISEIWQDVLQLQQVSTQENFFDLGGHSLRMAQMHRQLQETFQLKIPLIDLFQYPTIQSLAIYLQQMQAKECSSPIDRGSGPALQDRMEQIQDSKHRLKNLRQRQKQMRGA